jgi:hypothetical protein
VFKKLHISVRNVSKYFIRYETETTDKPMALDVIEEIIEKYNNLLKTSDYDNFLLFWKNHEKMLYLMAPLTEK